MTGSACFGYLASKDEILSMGICENNPGCLGYIENLLPS